MRRVDLCRMMWPVVLAFHPLEVTAEGRIPDRLQGVHFNPVSPSPPGTLGQKKTPPSDEARDATEWAR